MATVLKATSKGQITLPAKWRKHFSTNQFVAHENGDVLEIRPLDLDALHSKEDSITVFDAIRDNQGKGIYAEDFIGIVQKSLE